MVECLSNVFDPQLLAVAQTKLLKGKDIFVLVRKEYFRFVTFIFEKKP